MRVTNYTKVVETWINKRSLKKKKKKGIKQEINMTI